MYKILEKNGIDNENIDGGAMNNFVAAGRNGIVSGVLSECSLISIGSSVGVLPGLLLIHGIRVKITLLETINLSSVPFTPTRYQLVAQIKLSSNNDVEFSLFVQRVSSTSLIQDALYSKGSGTYQVELGRFTHDTSGSVSDVVRTLDIITGGTGGSSDGVINIGNVNTITLDPGVNAEVDVDSRIDEEDGKTYTDFKFSIPQGNKGDKGDTGAKALNYIGTSIESEENPVVDNEISIPLSSFNRTPLTEDACIVPWQNTAENISFITIVKILSVNSTDVTGKIISALLMTGEKGDKGDKGDSGITEGTLSVTINGTAKTFNGSADVALGSIYAPTAAGNRGQIPVWNNDGTIAWRDKYAVGEVYISFEKTSPAAIYGGDWGRITNVFLYSTGLNGASGGTGGEATHTLTVDEMPSHEHALRGGYGSGSGSAFFRVTDANGGEGWWTAFPTGGSQSHNNLPPYIRVHMWRRIA